MGMYDKQLIAKYKNDFFSMYDDSEIGFVYRYIFNNEIVYVGQAKNLSDRVKQHCKELKFYGITNIEWILCPLEYLNWVESRLIVHYNPAINIDKKIRGRRDEKADRIINFAIANQWNKYGLPINFEQPLVSIKKEKCASGIMIVKEKDDFELAEIERLKSSLETLNFIIDSNRDRHQQDMDRYNLLFEQYMELSSMFSKQHDTVMDYKKQIKLLTIQNQTLKNEQNKKVEKKKNIFDILFNK